MGNCREKLQQYKVVMKEINLMKGDLNMILFNCTMGGWE